jgi:hypothetical protein
LQQLIPKKRPAKHTPARATQHPSLCNLCNILRDHVSHRMIQVV